MNRTTGIAAGLVVGIALLGWWYMSAGDETVPAPAEVFVEPPAAPVEMAETPPPAPLPPVGDSDPLLRELAESFGAGGAASETILASDGVVGRFVRIVDAIATGSSPRGELAALEPSAPFAVRADGGRFFVDPDGYARYDAVASAVARVDAAEAVAAFRQIEPLTDQVYSQIVGRPSAFRPVLLRAIEIMLAVPVLNDAPELFDNVESYRYSDDTLEALSLPQKHLLRMGPANVGRIQARLRQISRLLGT